MITDWPDDKQHSAQHSEEKVYEPIKLDQHIQSQSNRLTETNIVKKNIQWNG